MRLVERTLKATSLGEDTCDAVEFVVKRACHLVRGKGFKLLRLVSSATPLLSSPVKSIPSLKSDDECKQFTPWTREWSRRGVGYSWVSQGLLWLVITVGMILLRATNIF